MIGGLPLCLVVTGFAALVLWGRVLPTLAGFGRGMVSLQVPSIALVRGEPSKQLLVDEMTMAEFGSNSATCGFRWIEP